MTVISTVDSQRFSFNGIEYFKNFTSIVVGNKIRILNTYDSTIELTDFPTLFSDFEVDGVIYGNVSDLQSALISVIYTRNSLGNVSKRTQLVSDCSGWQLNTFLTLVTVQAASSFSWNNTNQLKSSTPGNTTSAISLIEDNRTVPIAVVAYNSVLKKLTIEARYSYYRTEDRFVIGYFTKIDGTQHLTPTVLFDELVQYGNNLDGLYQQIEINSNIEIPAGALLVYAIASNDAVSSSTVQRFYALHTLIELEEI